MSTSRNYHPVVKELIELIQTNKWESKFEEALKIVEKYNISDMLDIKTIDHYLDWINDQLHYVPAENTTGKALYINICKFYFLLDQGPLLELQNKVLPYDKMKPLTPLSEWMVKYVNTLGEFMDTPESLTQESEKSFYESPIYNMDEYLRPRGGWKSFNQIFARNHKPGRRPIAAINDQTIVTFPADSTFAGQWEVRENSNVQIKGIDWKISELLEGSPYKDRFTGGHFMHSFLNTFDYHRQHTPLAGKVLESRVIQGTVYLEVNAVPISEDENSAKKINMKRAFDAPDNAGYEFMQTRGLLVLETQVGLVAILPMGMAQVSSVIMTAEVGQTLRKGEEISYFQFGGSDIVVVFEAATNINITAQPGVHYKYGTKLGEAYPVY